MAATATLVVEFSTDDETGADYSYIKAEIDSREDGLNEGRTQFRPGDRVGILVFPGSSTIDLKLQTAGGLQATAGGEIEVDQFVSFDETDEGTTSYPITRIVSQSWEGGGGSGAVSHVRNATLRAPSPVLGELRISYIATYQGFYLQGVPHNVERVAVKFRARA